MDPAATYVLIVLGVAIVLFVTDKVRTDLVALLVMSALLAPGIITPTEAFRGFSNPATVTIAAMFVLSAGLERAGAVSWIGVALAKVGGKSFSLALAAMMIGTAVVSAFINNTAAVAILLPTVMAMARELEVSPSKLLIPLSFASLFGGGCTLIGTSTTILVSSIAAEKGHAPIGMFEIAPLGLVLGSVGLIYMMTLGNRLLPDRGNSANLTDDFRMDDYLTELVIPPDSSLVNQVLGETPLIADLDLDVLAIFRDGHPMLLPHNDTVLEDGDILRIRCDLDAVRRLGNEAWARLRPRRHWDDDELEEGDAALVEAVVAPNSRLVGKTLREVDFRNRFGATVLAIRHHDHLVHSHLADTDLAAGDALLIEAPAEQRHLLRTHRAFVVVSDVADRPKAPRRVLPAVAVVTGVVVAAASGLAPIENVAVVGAVLMVVVGALNMDQAYRAIEWRVIFLLGGLLGLGTALETTGVAHALSQLLVQTTGAWGPVAVVSGVYLLTSLLTSVMSNNATAALVMPIALSAAASLGLDPRPLVIAVAFGASASFMTPVGYQTNLLVYGPGSYRFSDYVRVGGPLNLLFWLIATFLIPVFWPF